MQQTFTTVQALQNINYQFYLLPIVNHNKGSKMGRYTDKRYSATEKQPSGAASEDSIFEGTVIAYKIIWGLNKDVSSTEKRRHTPN